MKPIIHKEEKEIDSKKADGKDKEKQDEHEKSIEASFKEIEGQLKQGEISKEQLYSWFKEEIERKDKEIERLKKDNHLLFMTALRANENKIAQSLTKSGTPAKRRK